MIVLAHISVITIRFGDSGKQKKFAGWPTKCLGRAAKTSETH